MKIGIEAQRIFRPKKHGMEIVAVELIKNLQQIDLKNEYFLFIREDFDRCIEESANFKIILLKDSFPIFEQFRLPYLASKLGLDFLHCTSNTGPVFCRTPIVITLHDIIYLESITFRGSSYQNFGNLYRRFIVPRLIRKSKKIITVSDFEKAEITTKFPGARTKTEVVYNGVHPDFQPIHSIEELEYVRDFYALPKNFILFLGNKAPRKNMRNVMLAYALALEKEKNLPHLVITSFEQPMVDRYVIDLGLSKYAGSFVGKPHVKKEHLPHIYNLATQFLYPSLREGFGLPILEAMACGTPVITSESSSMPEVAGGAALLVDPQSPESIANAVLVYYNDSDLVRSNIQKGFKNSLKFNWKATAESVLTIYENLNHLNYKRLVI